MNAAAENEIAVKGCSPVLFGLLTMGEPDSHVTMAAVHQDFNKIRKALWARQKHRLDWILAHGRILDTFLDRGRCSV